MYLEPDIQLVEKFYNAMFGDLIIEEKHEEYWLSINYISHRGKIGTEWCQISDEKRFIKIVNKFVKNRLNVYVGLGGRTQNLGTKRGAAEDVGLLPCVWVEVDYGQEGHSGKGYPPTLEDAINLVKEFPLEPSMIIHSGNGIHAYWLFKEFWIFKPKTDEWERAKNYVANFQKTIKHYAKQYGWKIDTTHDIARILRVSGTFNLKYEPKPVKIISFNENLRYTLEELESYFLDLANEKAETLTTNKTLPKNFNYKPSDWQSIVNGCAFVQNAIENAKTLSEPDWYKSITIAIRSQDGEKGGRTIAHEISQPHPKYTKEETDKKINRALIDTGPFTCQKIAVDTDNEFCKHCKYRGKINSPITIGMQKLPEIEQAISLEDEAQRFFEKLGSKTVFVPKKLSEEIIAKQSVFSIGKQIYYYHNGKYYPNGEMRVRQLVREKLGNRSKRAHTVEVIYDIQTITQKNDSEINVDDGLVSVKNGLLNWRTGELLPHTHDRLSTVQLPVVFNPHAKCPNIERFLREVVSLEDANTLLEWIGYHLLQNCKFQKGIILLGVGSNGKSVFLDLLIKFIGEENVSNVSLQDLEHNQFKRAQIFGKMANIYSDIPTTRLDKSDVIKMAIAGDRMDGEFKWQDSFSFRNFAKLTFSANERPSSADVSHGFFRRWILVDFPNQFIEGVNADPNILSKITTEEELSGLLNLAIEGLKRLHKQRQFTISNTSKQLISEWQKEVDNVRSFVEECCVQSDDGETYVIEKEELHRIYKEWCVESGYTPKGRNNFYKRLQQVCPQVIVGRIGNFGKPSFYGIETTIDVSKKYNRHGFPREVY